MSHIAAEIAEDLLDIEDDIEVSQDLAMPMKGKQTTRQGGSIGRVTLYHVETGEARTFTSLYLETALKKRLPDGRRAFSARPTVKEVKGKVMCYLHPDHPERQRWYDAGIMRTCMSAGFMSVTDMEAQMEHKHSREWARMKDIIQREEREEERQFQRQLLREMQAARGVPINPINEVPAGVEYELKGTPVTKVDLTEPVEFTDTRVEDWKLNGPTTPAPWSADAGKVPCDACGKLVKPKGITLHKLRWCPAKGD